jgi:Uma2 family endonuclease
MSLKRYENPDEIEPRRYSIEEYLEFEYNAETKHEYNNGLIIECAYTSENHGRIVSNFTRLLGNCLQHTDCDVFASDRMVYAASCKRFFYPDLTIVCGEREYYQYSKNMKATINPSVLIEVLSYSTESTDKGEKWRCFRKIKSLKQYVLVDQDFKNIEIYERDEKGRWAAKLYEEEDDVLKIGDCEISINDIYLKVDLIEPNAASDSSSS